MQIKQNKMNEGKSILDDIKFLFPFNRSLTGEGTFKTLQYFKKKFNKLQIKKEKSGKSAFDWNIPKQWEIRDAWIKDMKGNKIINFNENNLHIVGYSTHIDKVLSKRDLFKKLHTLKKYPNAIPYVTSYYKKDWGFSLTYNQLKNMKDKKYKVFIDSSLTNGNMRYGEILLKGHSKKEILLSANICHPSMVSNELSGPTILINLAKWLSKKKRNLSYRIIFIPETIGSITYIKKNLKNLKKNVIGGYTLTCLGNNGPFSYIKTKNNSLTDFITSQVLDNYGKKKFYSYLHRGSDERQFGSPNINIPIGSLCRSKHSEFKEYHNSMDNLKITNKKILQDSYDFIKKCINKFETIRIYKLKTSCEPFLLKRKISNHISVNNKTTKIKGKDILDILAYSDGKICFEELRGILGMSSKILEANILKLQKKRLLERLI